MDSLRLILIIIGIIIVVLIYLWDRYQSKIKFDKRVVNMPGKEDDPGIVISTKTEHDGDVSSELANLKSFMGEKAPIEAEDEGITATEAGYGSDITAEGPEQLDSLETPADTYMSSPVADEDIVTLHIVAREGSVLKGKDIRDIAEGLGFEFGDMNIFHYHAQQAQFNSRVLFSLVNMYEPGYFNPDNMVDFTTRGISIFACITVGEQAVTIFDEMLQVSRKMAEGLDAVLCGPERHPINTDIIAKIRRQIKNRGR